MIRPHKDECPAKFTLILNQRSDDVSLGRESHGGTAYDAGRSDVSRNLPSRGGGYRDARAAWPGKPAEISNR